MTIKRILGLDYGQKRIGVAISDPLGWTAQAHPYIANAPDMWKKIASILEEYEIAEIVLGNPKNRDGSKSKKTEEVGKFAAKLHEKTGMTAQFWDERYSTVAAEKHLIEAGLSRQKRKETIDSVAAVFILQGYIDRMRNQ